MKCFKKIDEKSISKFYTLNTWDDETIGKACQALRLGMYVHMSSTAVGHTMARMVEFEAISTIEKIFGDDVETVFREGWGDAYMHLVVKPCPCCGRPPEIAYACGEYFVNGPCENMRCVSFFHSSWDATRKDWNKYVDDTQHVKGGVTQ